VKEIDPSAFDSKVWLLLKFDGAPPLLITSDFLCSVDSRILLKSFMTVATVRIPAAIEVIGPGAFSGSRSIANVVFESATTLKEIGEGAFADCHSLTTFHVPSSVETIGDRCFERCFRMGVITFGHSSKLKRIGEHAFMGSRLKSITIPASTEEIDGSTFVGCPLTEIPVARGNCNFKIEGNALVNAKGTEFVRYFG
jgi:hypothetical protein